MFTFKFLSENTRYIFANDNTYDVGTHPEIAPREFFAIGCHGDPINIWRLYNRCRNHVYVTEIYKGVLSRDPDDSQRQLLKVLDSCPPAQPTYTQTYPQNPIYVQRANDSSELTKRIRLE